MTKTKETITYHVEIVETLRKVVDVELPAGSSKKDAIDKVRDLYNKEEIVLSADDHCDTDIYLADEE